MLEFQLNNFGMLNQLFTEDFNIKIKKDDLAIVTNRKTYNLSSLKISIYNNSFKYTADDAEFTLTYETINNTSFINRILTVKFFEKTELIKIVAKTQIFKDKFMYNTFYNASAAVFARNEGLGVCYGFENPFCELEDNYISFEPSLILEKNEEYICDKNFFGAYPLFGEMIQPQLYKTQINNGGRYHPRYRNPSEGIPLYFSEIKRFAEYTNTYFDCKNKKFKFTSYLFFGNLPQRPETDEEINAYFNHIDNFSLLGGDTIILNPLYPNKIPNENSDSYWELFPENTNAEKILNYAKSKGLKIGIYMGTAGNGRYGNSSMINYADNPRWKKIDINGKISEENCIADDDFTDWFIKVQINTIRKYSLDVWNWDPGPGNGFFCFNPLHNHIIGKGGYKGFRNSLKVMKTLKEEFPNLYIQGFHGNKEYGLWGFKYIDQHEAFWENEVYVMNPIFDDLSVDRATANGIRLQSFWNFCFRFMPPTLNHGLAHRMIQACWMKEINLDKPFDYIGWKYALLSSIASGGSVTLPIIPEDVQNVNEYIEFYKKWIEFAKNIFEYSKNTIPFGSQTGSGIDGFSKIINNNGYIFLFNPFSIPLNFEFSFNECIGFNNSVKPFYLSTIYPFRKNYEKYHFGENFRMIIPAYECIILKIKDFKSDLPDERTSSALPRTILKNQDNCFTFFADEKIKSIISEFNIDEEAINVQDHYSKRFGRINNCWNRPDRIWIWINSSNNSDTAKIKINNNELKLSRDSLSFNELCENGLYFADITDYISFGEINKISLYGLNSEFIYLHYPKPQTEELPNIGFDFLPQKNLTPLLDNNVKIISAKINNDNVIIQNAENELKVQVNLPENELEGVYVSVPISIGGTGLDLKRDMILKFKDGFWYKKFLSGPRINLIIDDSKICVWAVTKNGKESKTFDIPINWTL